MNIVVNKLKYIHQSLDCILQQICGHCIIIYNLMYNYIQKWLDALSWLQ